MKVFFEHRGKICENFDSRSGNFIPNLEEKAFLARKSFQDGGKKSLEIRERFPVTTFQWRNSDFLIFETEV